MKQSQNKLKSFVAAFMAFLMAFSPMTALASSNNFEDVSPASANVIGTAWGDGWLPHFLTYFGSPIGTGFYSVEINGEQFIAYCLDARLPSPQQISSYQVQLMLNATHSTTVDATVSLDVLNEILSRGWPERSASELGLNSDRDAYYATRMALAMHTNYTQISGWAANPNNTGTNGTLAYRQLMLQVAREIAGFPMGAVAPLTLRIEPVYSVSNEEIVTARYNLPYGAGAYITDDEIRENILLRRQATEYLYQQRNTRLTTSTVRFGFDDIVGI